MPMEQGFCESEAPFHSAGGDQLPEDGLVGKGSDAETDPSGFKSQQCH